MRPLLSALVATALLAACGDNQTVPVPHTGYQGAAPQPLPCVPNLDGQIDASELQAAIGVPESLLVSPAGATRTVALTGTVDPSGVRRWDLSFDDGSDQLVRTAASDLSGKWYAASFPTGQFVAAIDAAGTLEGVYRHDDDAVSLLGIASAVQHPPAGTTLLPYQQPVALYRFPLAPGKSYVSVGLVQNGTLRGLPYAARDTYVVSVDAAGTLELPDLTFQQALRVKTQLTIEPAVGQSVVTQQSSWLFECFGEVARATSAVGETNPDFTTAAELRRLSLARSTP